jgi:hypothetical protein
MAQALIQALIQTLIQTLFETKQRLSFQSLSFLNHDTLFLPLDEPAIRDTSPPIQHPLHTEGIEF